MRSLRRCGLRDMCSSFVTSCELPQLCSFTLAIWCRVLSSTLPFFMWDLGSGAESKQSATELRSQFWGAAALWTTTPSLVSRRATSPRASSAISVGDSVVAIAAESIGSAGVREMVLPAVSTVDPVLVRETGAVAEDAEDLELVGFRCTSTKCMNISAAGMRCSITRIALSLMLALFWHSVWISGFLERSVPGWPTKFSRKKPSWASSLSPSAMPCLIMPKRDSFSRTPPTACSPSLMSRDLNASVPEARFWRTIICFGCPPLLLPSSGHSTTPAYSSMNSSSGCTSHDGPSLSSRHRS
mmetsp:Transcript_3896/g.10446  ORF Transcript_3896/g.10446 Transcript_3896/m.10446 type:complete len:299 (-) Transcript_3896:787-1683(-)